MAKLFDCCKSCVELMESGQSTPSRFTEQLVRVVPDIALLSARQLPASERPERRNSGN